MAFDANDLSPHEHFVVERTRAGEIADFTAMAGPGGAKPSLRAGVLRKLILGLDAAWPVEPPGVRVRAARIEGGLDLTDCSGVPALALEGCELPEPIDFSRAHLRRLSLAGSRLRRVLGAGARIEAGLDLSEIAPLDEAGALYVRLPGAQTGADVTASGAKLARAIDNGAEFGAQADAALVLNDARIAGALRLDGGFDVLGAVWGPGAEIGGDVVLNGAQLLNRRDDAQGAALVLTRARIGGGIAMRDGFKAEGAVLCEAARVSGSVDAEGASFRNAQGVALSLAEAQIGGAVAGALKAAGRVSLAGASVGGRLDLSGAEIADPLTPRGDSFGLALDGAGVQVGGDALFYGANVKGELRLAGARIGGELGFGGGRYINGGGWAIRAPGVRTGGDVTLKLADSGFAPHGPKTVIEGGASLESAEIGGALGWSAVELRGPGPAGAKGALFTFAGASIAGALKARGLNAHQESLIDASGASCGALADDPGAGWGGAATALALDGFSYTRLDEPGRAVRQRLGWLGRAPHFSAAPFAQLARGYAADGRREQARRVALAQRDQATLRASPGPLSWLLSSAFGLIAGYGLAPLRMLRALVLFLALGVAGVLAMNAQGALVTPQGQACNGAVEPALYALDLALPLIDLGQQGRCGPGRTARAELAQGVAVGETDWRLFEGVALWRWAYGLYALLGALLAGLAVVTFSGVLRPTPR